MRYPLKARVTGSFLFWWWFASTTGFFLAVFAHFPGDFRIVAEIQEFVWATALFGGTLGTIFALQIGIFQWLVLRRTLAISPFWILAIALSVGFTHALNDATPHNINLEIMMFLGSVFSGIVQALVLQKFIWTHWWFIICSFAWLAAWHIGLWVITLTGLYFLTPESGHDIDKHIVFAVVFGSVYSLITGFEMMILLQQKPKLEI